MCIFILTKEFFVNIFNFNKSVGQTAFCIIDVQNDFLKEGKATVNGVTYTYSEGSLGVKDGCEIISKINAFMEANPKFYVAASQDFHPQSHGSFASTHNVEPFTMGELNGGSQMFWPDHCVQGTFGAEFAPGLAMEKVKHIVQKGLDPKIDSYSAFFDNGGNNPSDLHAHLQKENVKEVVLAGIATDYCVKFTALDAKALGYGVTVLIDLCRGVNEDLTAAIEEMKSKGIKVMTVQEYEDSKLFMVQQVVNNVAARVGYGRVFGKVAA